MERMDRQNPVRITVQPSDVLMPVVVFALVRLYGGAGWAVAAVSALVLGAVSVAAGGFYRYVCRLVPFPYARAAYVAVAAFITLDAVLAVYALAYGSMDLFLNDLALWFAAVIAVWALVFKEKCPAETDNGEPFADRVEDTPVPDTAGIKESGRITVKKGSSIHIVETSDILYIAAMGDYVSLVTAAGRYVKEGTMQYYESVLPEGFVRVHRSTIVNIPKISAVELYGKQSYSIKMCNGESVKASAGGYRLLKEKLDK